MGDAGAFDAALDALAQCSAPGPGVTRFVYDESWCAAHRHLVEWASRLGVRATPDAAGNLLIHDAAWAPGPSAPPALLVGSHLDTVREGGRLDGAYGALAGIVLAARHRGRPGPPVVGFVTCEEEQSRFDSHMMGARSLLGLVQANELDSVRDAQGGSWREALAFARARGCAAPLPEQGPPFARMFRAVAQLELHIEQGPALFDAGDTLGIVEHIAGYQRVRVTLTGAARHAGTTPLARRRDALAAAAEIVLAAESLALRCGEPARATCGFVRTHPGLYNVVAGAAELGIEVRHAEPQALAELEAEIERLARAIVLRRGVALDWQPVSRQAPTALSSALVARAEALAARDGLRFRRMVSGAAHDSMEFARAGIPSLMLFVPSIDGISHAPDERTDPAALWAGVEFASRLLDALAGEAIG